MERSVSDFHRVQALADLGCHRHCGATYNPLALRCFESGCNGLETRTRVVFLSRGPPRLGEDMSARSRILRTPRNAIQCLSDTVLDKILAAYLILIGWTHASAERSLDIPYTIPVRDIPLVHDLEAYANRNLADKHM